MGDGNIHIHVHMKKEDPPLKADIEQAIYGLTATFQGSFSAEHGIGLKHVEALSQYKSKAECDLMRAIKKAFDPKGILNPGKVIAI